MILPVRRKTDNFGYRLAWDSGCLAGSGDSFVGQGIVSVAKRISDIGEHDNKANRIAEIAAFTALRTPGVQEDEFGYWWKTIREVLMAGIAVVKTMDEYV